MVVNYCNFYFVKLYLEPEAYMEEEVKDEDVELHCCAEEQKEVSYHRFRDESCRKVAEKGHAGLCK